MMINSASAGLHTFQRTLRVSAKGDGIGEQRHTRGGGRALRGTQYRKKNWQIPKYRVKNRRNTDTAFIFGHAYLKVYPSRVFVYLKYFCTSNQPQPSRGNVRRPRIQSVQRSKRMPYQFHHRLSVRNCVIIYHFKIYWLAFTWQKIAINSTAIL